MVTPKSSTRSTLIHLVSGQNTPIGPHLQTYAAPLVVFITCDVFHEWIVSFRSVSLIQDDGRCGSGSPPSHLYLCGTDGQVLWRWIRTSSSRGLSSLPAAPRGRPLVCSFYKRLPSFPAALAWPALTPCRSHPRHVS